MTAIEKKGTFVLKFEGEVPGAIRSIVVTFERPGGPARKDPKLRIIQEFVNHPDYEGFRDIMAACANEVLRTNLDTGKIPDDGGLEHAINDLRASAQTIYKSLGQPVAFGIYGAAFDEVSNLGPIADLQPVQRGKLAEILRNQIQEALNNPPPLKK